MSEEIALPPVTGFQLIKMFRVDLGSLDTSVASAINAACVELSATGFPLRTTFLFQDKHLILVGHRQEPQKA